ncbi:hypothetical protein QFZ87_000743 [Bacillus sp. SLBN-46]|uniref:CBO0543 family protein n=1 Tax=Bacillus sp. SLBN-46 TaxID=3042283 RepID=UPI002857797C|nr:hypothetical protein [Bacillus sp. SLBN-46]
MHITLTAILLLAAIRKGDWRHWRKYHHTILYIVICNLLYNFLCRDHLLWKQNPDLLPESHAIVDLIYTFIALPAVTLIYLTHYPFKTSNGKQVQYMLWWILGSLVVEYPYYKMGRLLLQHGYHFWMEPIFYTAMYTMLRLHFTRPLLTYGISTIVIVLLLQYFHIPVK